MTAMRSRWFTLLGTLPAAIALAAVASACAWVEEDLSDCPVDEETVYELDYELQLVTNMTTELQTQLTTLTEVSMASALTQHLVGVFTDHAHDVDLSFYDVAADSLRLHHEEHIMDANQQSYTLNIARRKYMHTALANLIDNAQVATQGSDRCHTQRLVQLAADTLDSHTTGLFTARLPMEMSEGVNQTFNVHLYMANCASALVIDPRGHDMSGVRVFATGFATQFQVADSSYTFPTERVPVLRATRVDDALSTLCSFCTVSFPSPEAPQPSAGRGTRTVIETTEPFESVPTGEELWQLHAYVTQPDGTITQTILAMRQPLRAGQLRVVKAWIGGDGEVLTDDQTVGVSVKLNWQHGPEWVVPL